MTISVVIPSFNQGRYLNQCLNSIFRQHRPADEILVLDGGSTDESHQILSHHSRELTFWRSYKDRGQAAAVNEGINRAQGDWIAWVNSDDLLMPDALSAIDAITKSDSCSVISGGSLWTNEDLSSISVYPAVRSISLEDFADGASPLCQPSTLFKRDVWLAVGGLNEELHFALDYEFFIRVLKSHQRPRMCKTYIAVNRVHECSKTQSGNLIQELQQVAAQHFGSARRPYPKSAFEKYGSRLLRKYPLWFLIGCQIAGSKRKRTNIPGYPISCRSKLARSARMAAGV